MDESVDETGVDEEETDHKGDEDGYQQSDTHANQRVWRAPEIAMPLAYLLYESLTSLALHAVVTGRIFVIHDSYTEELRE